MSLNGLMSLHLNSAWHQSDSSPTVITTATNEEMKSDAVLEADGGTAFIFSQLFNVVFPSTCYITFHCMFNLCFVLLLCGSGGYEHLPQACRSVIQYMQCYIWCLLSSIKQVFIQLQDNIWGHSLFPEKTALSTAPVMITASGCRQVPKPPDRLIGWPVQLTLVRK